MNTSLEVVRWNGYIQFKQLLATALACFLLCTCVDAAEASSSTQEKADQLVFLIHGVGGNENSFGHMNEALTKHLNASSELGQVKVFTFKYPTQDDKMSTDDFALLFDQFIHKNYVESANSNATISIVAHSQGGLVTTTWYYKSRLQEEGFHPELAEKLKTVVTLGTPYWGSKVATWVANNTGLFRSLKKNLGERLGPVNSIGERQVLDMALGSHNTQKFRRNLMAFTKKEIEEIFTEVRVLNIHGNANLKRILMKKDVGAQIKKSHSWFSPDMLTHILPFVFGSVEYEADGMVSVPASTLNTIFLTDMSMDYKDGDKKTAKNFGELRIADRLIVKTVHASTDPELINDMAYAPSVCVSDANCDHPTFSHVLNYLKNGSMKTDSSLERTLPPVLIGSGKLHAADDVQLHNFGGFTLDVNVRLPMGYEHVRKEVKVYIHGQCLEGIPTVDISKVPRVVVNRGTELYAHVQQLPKTYPDTVMNWYTGHFLYSDHVDQTYDRKFREEGTTVRLSIVAPNMKTRHIEALVKPTLSTYIDVVLAPQDIKK